VLEFEFTDWCSEWRRFLVPRRPFVSESLKRTYRLGNCTRMGQRCRCRASRFKCAILLEHSGELVTREELRQKVWPEDTFVDFDHALNTAITKIRLALGDEADNPRFVETLPRRGYRFIGPVDKPSTQTHTATSSGVGIEAAPERNKPTFLRPWMAIAFLSAAVIAVLLWALWRYPSQPTEIVERKLTANSSENSANSAAVSPDGEFLAYTDDTGIYLKQVRTGETHP
jgi:DNA-binding winged helix-turn-helix (wHTH) protein